VTQERTESGGYECPRCQKTFQTLSELRDHERVPQRSERTVEVESKNRLGTHEAI